MPPASPGSSSRSVSGSDPGFLQITASMLGLRACQILQKPLKGGVCFLLPSGSPEHKPHWPSKSDVLGARLHDAGPPGWGVQYGAWTAHSSGKTSAIVIILPFMGCLPRDEGLDYTASPSLLPVSFFIFSVVENLVC